MPVCRFPFIFFSEGVRLSGTLRRNVADLLTPQPTIVVSGSWLTVKEQMADLRQAPRRGVHVVAGYKCCSRRESTMPDDRAAEVVVSKMLFAIDGLDWPGVRAALADEVEIDYTSLFGGAAERLAADALVQRWQGLLPGFVATQHLTGPIVVTGSEGSRATAETHVRGYHYMDSDVWMVAGHYVMRLERAAAGWKISGIRLDTYRQEGNRDLPAAAIENVKKGRVRSQR